ncbi:MAG: hypothetical protein K2Q18_16025 [Bdellovibrionales bacterium]|nr:hypothetical protein [Bdellovibrionales bacterium]
MKSTKTIKKNFSHYKVHHGGEVRFLKNHKFIKIFKTAFPWWLFFANVERKVSIQTIFLSNLGTVLLVLF